MRTALKLAHFSSVPADSEIHVKGRKLRKVLVSIDVGVSELLLARNPHWDEVIALHPAGVKAQHEGDKHFLRHIDQLKAAGVPSEAAQQAVKNKYRILDIQHHPENYDQVPNAAKKLGLPLVTIHSPCDEIGRRMIVQAIKGLDEDAKVGQLVSRFCEFLDFCEAESLIVVRFVYYLLK